MSNNYIPIFVRNENLAKENILAEKKVNRYRKFVVATVTITLLLFLSTFSAALSFRSETNKAVAIDKAEQKAVSILDTAEEEADTSLATARAEAEKITGG